MKKAKDYINISNLSFKSKTLQIGIIEEWIKAAQIDTIDATVKMCAENANLLDSKGNISSGVSVEEYEDELSWKKETIDYMINKQSILQIAEQLKKELECDQ